MNPRSVSPILRRLGVAGLLTAAVAAWLGFAVTPHAQAPSAAACDPTVVLVSFDAWRADYHTRTSLPNLERLMARGVRAEYLIPSFPSKTFPNHYTIVTGLYPGHHGIVANNIWDAPTGRTFSLSKRHEVQDPMWWGGEPIWVTVSKAGLPSATMFWPGSEAPIGGIRPTHWLPYDEDLPPSERVERVLAWLDRPSAERPRFIGLYFEDTDTVGHAGPELPAVIDALKRSDDRIGQLVSGIDARGLSSCVNVIIVSDHGMAPTSTARVIVLDDYISLDDVRVVDINPTLGLVPIPGAEDRVYRALRNAHPRLKVYRRGETPDRWHYRDHPRIPSIVGAADEGWQIMTRAMLTAATSRGQGRAGGQHGYDPRAKTMRSLFVAAGPAIRQGVVVKPFENVSVYNMLARIIGVTPAPNDGDPLVVSRVLRSW